MTFHIIHWLHLWLQLHLGTLIICSYWINYHLLNRQNLQLILAQSQVHLPNKIQIDPSKPFCRINQYSVNKEGPWGIKPIIEDDKARSFTIPCTSPCNTSILSVRKPNGQMEVCPRPKNSKYYCFPLVSCCFQPSYATDIHSYWKQIFQNLTMQNIFSMLTDENS